MTTLVTMRKVQRGRPAVASLHRQIIDVPSCYIGRAVTWADRVMVLNREGNVLFNGSRALWTRLVSLGLAAGGPSPLPGEPPPAQR